MIKPGSLETSLRAIHQCLWGSVLASSLGLPYLPVEVGDKEPCDSKDKRTIKGLETIVALGNGQVEMRAFPPKQMTG